MLKPLILAAVVVCIHSATIGDGLRSLISGKAVDYRSGSCSIGGRSYASETSVPRDHPCHYCICYDGRIDCFWKKCGNVPDGCQVMAFEGTCNPSLYVCSIDEKAHSARLVTSTDPQVVPLNGRPASAVTKQITTSPDLTGTKTPSSADAVTPPSVHLLPPPLPAAYQRGRTPPRQKIMREDSKFPSQFGLRMKQKMRFTRDTSAGLPFSIQEDFPVAFDRDFVVGLDHQIRSRRAINGSATRDNSHRQHHSQLLDRGCTILGVRYELGDVVGIATDVCQECRCAAQSLYCSPKCCFKVAPFQINDQHIRAYQNTPTGNSNEPVVQHPLHFVQSQFA